MTLAQLDRHPERQAGTAGSREAAGLLALRGLSEPDVAAYLERAGATSV